METNLDLAYNITSPVTIRGFIMNSSSICFMCAQPFKRTGREQSCSLKCRLLEGVQKNDQGCWVWKGSKGGDYGKITFKRRSCSTHKASYLTFKGPVPSDKWVCHTCDNTLCINPEHLFLGSPSDNRRDCINKRRIKMGEDHKWSKFTEIQTSEMRKMKQEGFSYRRLAGIFNCSITHLVNVIKDRVRT